MPVRVKSVLDWISFYEFILKRKIDYKIFLQKIIETEEFMWKIVKFGLHMTIVPKWEDLFVKIVFWLQNEKDLSEKIIENFKDNLEKFISDYSELIKKKVYYREWEIIVKYLEAINCWSIDIKLNTEKKEDWSFVTPYYLYLRENIVFENIFRFFYEDFLWIKDTKDIFINRPTDKDWDPIELIENKNPFIKNLLLMLQVG